MSSRSNLIQLLDPKHQDAAPQEYTDADAAFAFLKEAARIKANMAHFTEMWTNLRPKRLKDREIKDRDVLKGLAGLLASDALRLKSRERHGGGGGEEDAPAPAQPAPRRKPRVLTGSGMKIRERPDPVPPAPPPPPINVAQQVAALLAAAKSGVPFVEQCSKSR